MLLYLSRDIDIPDADDVLGEEPGEAAGTVRDGELLSVDLVRLGGLRVVLVVQEAGDVGVVALLARHPQVARARVEDDLEGLRRSADGDRAEVLRVHVVRQGLGLGAGELVAPPL